MRVTDRVLLQYGVGLAPLDGYVVETVDLAVADRIEAALGAPNGGLVVSTDHVTVTPLPVPPPDPAVVAAAQQRLSDAVTMLNSSAVMADQATRDAFARQIGVQPLVIPLTQKATPADILPLRAA